MKNILKKILNKKKVAKKAKVTKKSKVTKKVAKVKKIKNKSKSLKVIKSIKNIKLSKLNKNNTKKNVDENKKKLIIEALWNFVYSDKNADMYETNLMRRLSGLLYLDIKVVGDIKEKVMKKNDVSS